MSSQPRPIGSQSHHLLPIKTVLLAGVLALSAERPLAAQPAVSTVVVRPVPIGVRPTPYGPRVIVAPRAIVVSSPAPTTSTFKIPPNPGTVIGAALVRSLIPPHVAIAPSTVLLNPVSLPGSLNATARSKITSTALQVTSLGEGTARDAGLQSGDIILSVDGKEIHKFTDLRSALTASNGQSVFHVYVPTTGAAKTIDVKVVNSLIGASVIEVPVTVEEDESQYAVQVKSVEAGGANSAGIVAGDVILSLDGKPIHNEDELRSALVGSDGQSRISIYKPSTRKVETIPITVQMGRIGATVEKVQIEIEK